MENKRRCISTLNIISQLVLNAVFLSANHIKCWTKNLQIHIHQNIILGQVGPGAYLQEGPRCVRKLRGLTGVTGGCLCRDKAGHQIYTVLDGSRYAHDSRLVELYI
jgi:hypothetical protein